MALELTDANFEDLVLKSEKPVVVDFGQFGVVHAEW
jgi:thioredoxin-like negative regulator of GroEL